MIAALPERDRIGELDGLRAIALLIVVIWHYFAHFGEGLVKSVSSKSSTLRPLSFVCELSR